MQPLLTERFTSKVTSRPSNVRLFSCKLHNSSFSGKQRKARPLKGTAGGGGGADERVRWGGGNKNKRNLKWTQTEEMHCRQKFRLSVRLLVFHVQFPAFLAVTSFRDMDQRRASWSRPVLSVHSASVIASVRRLTDKTE